MDDHVSPCLTCQCPSLVHVWEVTAVILSYRNSCKKQKLIKMLVLQQLSQGARSVNQLKYRNVCLSVCVCVCVCLSVSLTK